MIKRTPQEIADFYGCYVAQDKSGDWYLYEKAPVADLSEAIWRDGGRSAETPHEAFMAVPENHDWTKLYEPQGNQGKTEEDFPNPDNKSNACYEDQADSDNKPNRLGEVYTHKEYVLLCEFQPGPLMQKVNELLQDGFRLYGNPWTGPDSNYGYIHYQAMVRGV